MTNLLRVTLLLLPLTACVDELGDAADPTLSEAEQALTGSTNLTFEVGYGEGYLSPIPPTRTGVADGMVGWIGDTVDGVFGPIRVAAFKTSNDQRNSYRRASVFLRWEGTVPATGTCTLNSGALLVDGWTRVEGHNPFPYTGGTDATAKATVKAFGYANGSLKYSHAWVAGSDATKSENRTKRFDRSYYLQSGPSFYATAGQYFELIIELDIDTWTNSEGEASVSIFQFGYLATGSANIVSIDCY